MGVVEEPLLFDVPEATPTFVQPEERFWPGVAKWSGYRGAHQPCAVYVRLCQENGFGTTPRHPPASKKRVGPNGTIFVCGMCAVDLEAQDKAAEVEAARRRAEVEKKAKESRANRRNLA